MTIYKDAFLLGLTGSFGSGCTTLGKALKESSFRYYSLSKLVREKWEELHPERSSEDAPREELQTIGNDLRKENGNDYLAKATLKRAKQSSGRIRRAVFDSIRNTAEIKVFRDSYPNFFLLAVDALKENRRERVKERQYVRLNIPEKRFETDDERDRNEEGLHYGQQVQLCVDEADVLIGNDADYPSETVAIRKFIDDIEVPYIKLLSGKEPRNPQPDESYMSIAYAASLLSKCIKRQVGAVILDEVGSVLSVGYNENPKGKPPCIDLYKMCYRDIYKQKLFRDLRNQQCPSCGSELGELEPPYRCPHCNLDLDRFYVRDKALARCTALHAEEKAIINANRRNLEGSTLYVTTFPCFMCAHKIMDIGISNIIYCEPYPDVESARVLKDLKDIHVERFEGVKSRAYFRLFGSWRKIMETKSLSSS